ncbi:MAG: histone H1 [Bernardetiaceae bacterium]
MKRYEELRQIVKDLEEDFERFYNYNHNPSGTQIRKQMQRIKELAQEIRKDVQEVRRQIKANKNEE